MPGEGDHSARRHEGSVGCPASLQRAGSGMIVLGGVTGLVGGAISTNAGGNSVIRYGMTRLPGAVSQR